MYAVQSRFKDPDHHVKRLRARLKVQEVRHKRKLGFWKKAHAEAVKPRHFVIQLDGVATHFIPGAVVEVSGALTIPTVQPRVE